MGRISRGWELTKLSFQIIGKNKSLLLFPVLSGVTIMLVLTTFVVGFWFFPAMADMPEVLWFIVGFLVYVILFFISFYFQSALVACAYETMEGGTPTMGFGLKKASARAFEIFKWAIIAAIVGMIIRAIEDRVPFASRIIGVAWGIGTYFVIPIIVFEGNGAWASMKQSWNILKSSWGETLVGNLAVGLIFFLLAIPGVIFFVMIAYTDNIYLIGTLVLAGIIYLVFMGILSSTVSSIMQAALYRYATTGKIGMDLPTWIPPPSNQAAQPYPAYEQQPQAPPSY